MAFYLHCNNGCGRRTVIASAAAGGATCPNCGEGGVTVLGDNDRKTTEGYDSSGVPQAGKGTPFNRTQSDMAKTGGFHHKHSTVAKQ